jgi:predicted ATPase
MAAGWAGILGIETLDARLDGALRARGAASPRHSTMSAALEWSFDLLAPAERSVLQRLAVFARGFSMADAETVVADKILTRHDVLEQVASLVRKSMIAVVAEPGMPRYRLFETTRAFVLEQLAQSEDAEIVRQRHADYVLYQLERATEEWETTSDPVWLNRHEILLDDLRAALEWATHRNPEQVVALAGASWLLWREMALHAEGRKRLEAAAKHLAPGTPARLEARLRRGLGELWSNTAAVQRARDEFGRAVELYRDLEDWFQLGAALSRLAFTQLILADGEDAKRSIAEALKLLGEFGAPHSLASAYSTEVCVEARVGSYEKACAVGARAIDLCEAIGAERVGFAIAGNLMECALERNDIDAALEQGRALAARLHDGMHPDLQAFVLGLLTSALVEHGEFDKALSVAREAAPLMRDEGILIRLLDHLALRAGLTDRLNDAARVFGYADSIYRASTQPREPILQRAADRLGEILDAAMPEVEIRQLGREGEKLSEDQVVALALKA